MPNDPIVDLHEMQRRRREREASCKARVRLFFVLWRVRCGGELTQRPSTMHPGRVYSVCLKCGDVGWTWPKKEKTDGDSGAGSCGANS
jgi:hypothetical protein